MPAVTCATIRDVEEILELQDRHLVHNVRPRDRAQGFLSTAFDEAMLHDTIADPGMFVARADDGLAAYLIMGRLDWYARFALVEHLLNRLAAGRSPRLTGEDLQDAVFYGPACIDTRYRGQGLLAALLHRARCAFVDRYHLGLTFVAEANRRSYAAHVSKLGMTEIDRFTFNGVAYCTLAFPISPLPAE